MDELLYLENKKLSKKEFEGKGINLKSFPQHLSIYSTDTCNLRCIGCAVGQKVAPMIAISDEGYKRIFDIFPYIQSVGLVGGEMFYDSGNPKGYVEEIFREGLKYPNLQFNGLTNGTLISPERAKLVTEKFTNLSVSIDSPKPDVFKTIRVGGNLDHIIQNIKRISELKAKKGSGRWEAPYIGLNFIIIEQTYKDLLDMVELASEVGAISVTFQAPWEGTFEEYDIFKDSTKTMEFISILKEATKKAENLKIKITNRTQNTITKYHPRLREHMETPENVEMNEWPNCCKVPWTELLINKTGNVQVCCTSPTVIGNINRNSLLEIWNSFETINLRKRILSGDYSKDCQKNCTKGYVLPNFNSKTDPTSKGLTNFLANQFSKFWS